MSTTLIVHLSDSFSNLCCIFTGSAGSEQHHAAAHSVGNRPSAQHSGKGRQHHRGRQGLCGRAGHSQSADGQQGTIQQAGAEANPRHRDGSGGP